MCAWSIMQFWFLHFFSLNFLFRIFNFTIILGYFNEFFSPTFYRIIKKKSVEEFKPDPYIATVLNCAFWVFYGLPFVHPHSILVLTINSIGLMFEFIYLTIFYIYATNKGRVRMLPL